MGKRWCLADFKLRAARNGATDYNQNPEGEGDSYLAESLGGRVAKEPKESKEPANNWTKVATIATVAGTIIGLLALLGITITHSLISTGSLASPPPATPTAQHSPSAITLSPASISSLSTSPSPTTNLLPTSPSTPVGQPSPQDTPRLTLSPSSGPAKTLVTATATGFTPGGLVQFDLDGALVGQADANEYGTARISFSIPADYASLAGSLDPDVEASEEFVGAADQIFKLT